jgi:hypothetical protein
MTNTEPLSLYVASVELGFLVSGFRGYDVGAEVLHVCSVRIEVLV